MMRLGYQVPPLVHDKSRANGSHAREKQGPNRNARWLRDHLGGLRRSYGPDEGRKQVLNLLAGSERPKRSERSTLGKRSDGPECSCVIDTTVELPSHYENWGQSPRKQSSGNLCIQISSFFGTLSNKDASEVVCPKASDILPISATAFKDCYTLCGIQTYGHARTVRIFSRVAG